MIYHQFRTTDKGIGKLSFVLLVIRPNAEKGDVDDFHLLVQYHQSVVRQTVVTCSGRCLQ